jgi:hypothetical protein
MSNASPPKQSVGRYLRLKRDLSTVDAAAPTHNQHVERIRNDLAAQRSELEALREAHRLDITHTRFGTTDFHVFTETMDAEAVVQPSPHASQRQSGDR